MGSGPIAYGSWHPRMEIHHHQTRMHLLFSSHCGDIGEQIIPELHLIHNVGGSVSEVEEGHFDLVFLDGDHIMGLQWVHIPA